VESLAEALIAMFIFGSVGGTIVLRGPLGKALADRIAGRTPKGEAQARDLAELVTGELEDVKLRLAELEERQDFSDRMLARQRQPDRLSEGS